MILRLDLTELRAGIEPELVAEQASEVLVGGQRLRLPPGGARTVVRGQETVRSSYPSVLFDDALDVEPTIESRTALHASLPASSSSSWACSKPMLSSRDSARPSNVRPSRSKEHRQQSAQRGKADRDAERRLEALAHRAQLALATDTGQRVCSEKKHTSQAAHGGSHLIRSRRYARGSPSASAVLPRPVA
jgi:hypothetical protein